MCVGGEGGEGMRITAFRASDEIQITNACTKCPGKHSAFHNYLLEHSGLCHIRFHSLN